MKKTLLFAIPLAYLAFSACKKKGNYDCTCGILGTSTNTYTTTIENATKDNASDLCYKYGAQYMPQGSFGCSVTVTP